jgi:hypothetical protein
MSMEFSQNMSRIHTHENPNEFAEDQMERAFPKRLAKRPSSPSLSMHGSTKRPSAALAETIRAEVNGTCRIRGTQAIPDTAKHGDTGDLKEASALLEALASKGLARSRPTSPVACKTSESNWAPRLLPRSGRALAVAVARDAMEYGSRSRPGRR